MGSVRVLTDEADSSSTLQNTNENDAYEQPLTTSETVVNPFRYTGEYLDEESGFIYLRARYYDPESQQFLTVDPALAWTEEAYNYVGGSPTNFTDPTGKFIWVVAIAVIAFSAYIMMHPGLDLAHNYQARLDAVYFVGDTIVAGMTPLGGPETAQAARQLRQVASRGSIEGVEFAPMVARCVVQETTTSSVGRLIYRFGENYESATRLARKAPRSFGGTWYTWRVHLD